MSEASPDSSLSAEGRMPLSQAKPGEGDTTAATGHLARDIRHGALVRRVRELHPSSPWSSWSRFQRRRASGSRCGPRAGVTFDSMLARILDAFALKVGERLGAQTARVCLVDPENEELFTLQSDSQGAVFAVLELIRPRDGVPFTSEDAAQLGEQARGLASVLARPGSECAAAAGCSAGARAQPGASGRIRGPEARPAPPRSERRKDSAVF